MIGGDSYIDGMSKLAFLLLLLVAVDQLKIEFLRIVTVDYLQFILALFAVLLAIGDIRVAELTQSESEDLNDLTPVRG